MLTRRALITSSAAAALTAATLSVPAAASAHGSHRAFPEVVPLPDGFQPEGIAIGKAPFAYFGSLANGDIYRANLATGRGSVISTGPGTPSVGLKVDDRGRLFVSGGAAGNGRVVDTHTGDVLASWQFASAPTFVNDVVLTPEGAFFTDSQQPFLYKVPLSLRGEPVRIPLTGDLVYGTGFNVNGIARTPDGRGLLVVQSNTGGLFRVAPDTGVTEAVDLGGYVLTNGDGLLTIDRTLYVVQNRLNQVAVFALDKSGRSGRLTGTRTSPDFDVPTTVAAYGNRLYLPNARFGITVTPETPFSAVAVKR
ncbi:SMP-30/gluconolactonase/LRE family protein [Phytohabitans kaempferiae]|uniref:SMP-30/gluconolactonase/LRE family protein n=1 Tax=Phytohabitans kaempferiae TaxID=1620943 RepID=A0ABV6MF64_9ACTN